MSSKRYSQNTIKTYTDAIRVFLTFLVGKNVSDIVESDVIRFNNEYILKRELSASYQNQVVNAIKLLVKVVDNRKINVENIHRPLRTIQLETSSHAQSDVLVWAQVWRALTTQAAAHQQRKKSTDDMSVQG